jgi:exosortase C (VPDSG-CTERM-specific)
MAPPPKPITLPEEITGNQPSGSRKRLFLFAGLMLVLFGMFSIPLVKLVRYAAESDLQSHTLLAPFIFLFLFRLTKKEPLGRPSFAAASVAAVCGVAGAAAYIASARTNTLSQNDALALATFAFYCCGLAIALATLGWRTLRPHRFAIGFLAFMIPLPLALTTGLSVFLQYASAELSNWTLRITGMPVFRDGLTFQLPGLRIFVAEECSGIRSTVVLFITSLLAAHLFLRTRWKKVVFVLCVIPLGVLRNAIRITTISWLTVNVDPGIIDSPLHHRGGPIFFALSLIPLFVLLWVFRRSDSRKTSPEKQMP